ncbi:MAG: aminoacyl-tRNA hydrolase [Anaerolineales bacterium]
MTDFLLLVGLGNPGPRYAGNRHNIGFRAVETLAEEYNLDFSRTEHRALTAHGTIGGRRVILAKPQTWMNDSGQAVAPLANFYKIPFEDLLVVYDDLDIPLGTVRFRQEGSSGGHRGVESVIQRLGTREFPRLRLGIGRPPGQMDAAAYVLQDFSAEEEPVLWEVLRLAKSLMVDWIKGEPQLLRQGMTWQVEA